MEDALTKRGVASHETEGSKVHWGNTDQSWQGKSHPLGSYETQEGSLSGELAEHAGKPRAGLLPLLKLVGKPTSRTLRLSGKLAEVPV